MKNYLKHISLVLSILFIGFSAVAQNSEKKIKKEKLRDKFTFERLSDGSAILNAYMFKKGSAGWEAVSGIELNFSVEDKDTITDLGSVLTDNDGNATIHIASDYHIPFDSTGVTKFYFEFKGNKELKKADGDLKLEYAKLRIDLVDGEKRAVIATVTDINNEPIKKKKVGIYVKRMHSLLPIGEEKTDKKGSVKLSFPDDIPGDYQGNLEIVAKIQKDKKIGDHTVSKLVDWGVKNTYVVSEDEKNLWTASAPTWMLILVFSIFAIVGVFLVIALKEVYLMSKDA